MESNTSLLDRLIAEQEISSPQAATGAVAVQSQGVISIASEPEYRRVVGTVDSSGRFNPIGEIDPSTTAETAMDQNFAFADFDPSTTPEVNLKVYEKFVLDMWKSPAVSTEQDVQRENFIMTTGLAEEAGEVLGKLKKWVRDGDGTDEDNAARQEAVLKECGDTLYYLTRLILRLGSSLSEVMDMNMKKLEDRERRGVQWGEGDDR